MTRNYRHILSGLLVCLCGLLLVACEKPAVYRITPSDNVYLSFSPMLVDEAGSDGTSGPGLRQMAPATAAQAEKLRSLRVVIVSEDRDDNGNLTGSHTVEVNEIYMSATTLQSDKMTFAVRDGRKKKIYLLGNVDGAHTIRNAAGEVVNLADPDLYKPTAPGGIAPIEECRFTWQAAERPNWIPVTAAYELTIPEKEQLTLSDGAYYYGMEEPLYLVRAVTKFSFSYVNETAEIGAKTYMRLRAWGLSQVADGPSYLLAKVADDWAQSTQPATDYATMDLPYTPRWPRWLADEAENSAQPDASPDNYEWMTAYELPQADHKEATYTYDANDYTYNIMPAEGTAAPIPLNTVYYLPESKYVPSGGDQEYQLEFRVLEWIDHNDNGREAVYTATLPNCRSLFRNTEIKLQVRFRGDAVVLETMVCPWAEHPDIIIPPFE